VSEPTQAEAFWITAVERSEIRPLELPATAAHEVRVRTLFSGISRGTELLVYQGNVPDTEYLRMQAPFQQGSFTFPVKYGYINVGRIIEGPPPLLSKTVFCLYPHQTVFNVPAESVYVLPEDLPPERAVLAANMETAVNALWDAQPSLGDRISVIGAGVVGLLVAYLANRIIGCQVQLIDINIERASIAQELGIAFSLPQQAADDQDLIIHASGSEEGLNDAIELAGLEARIIELSWFGARLTRVNLGGAFHSRRLQLRASQVGLIAKPQRARWDYQRRLNFALSLLRDERLDGLISAHSAFADLPQTMENLKRSDDSTLCHRICYS